MVINVKNIKDIPVFDELYDLAVKYAETNGKANTSAIQRYLKIGYNRAAHIVDMMIQNGVLISSDADPYVFIYSETEENQKSGRQSYRAIAAAHGINPDIADMVYEESNPIAIGHNSNTAQDVGGVAGKRLLVFVERVERLEGEKAALQEDIKEVYGEAKGVGFDTKIIRMVIRQRKMDKAKRIEQLELFDLYWSAIGES